MSFSIWSDSTDGDKLWQETQSTVSVNEGLFSVILGSQDPQNPIPLEIFLAQTRYLEVMIAGETLSPRQRIASVPYAYTSASVSGKSNVFPSEGNVGIGNTAPDKKLVVDGTIHSTQGGFKFPDGTEQTTAAKTDSGDGDITSVTAAGDSGWTTVSGGRNNSATGNHATVSGG